MSKLFDLLTAVIAKVKNTENKIPNKVSDLKNDAGYLTKQVQPDLNQNNPSAPDYVKNRTHWSSDPVDSVMIEETTAQFDDLFGMGMGVSMSIPVGELSVGDVGFVTFDGVDYTLTAIEDEFGYVYLGNLALFGGPDTGEPFCISVSLPERGEDPVILTQTIGEHTIKAIVRKQEIHTIPEKYLPTITDKVLSKDIGRIVGYEPNDYGGGAAVNPGPIFVPNAQYAQSYQYQDHHVYYDENNNLRIKANFNDYFKVPRTFSPVYDTNSYTVPDVGKSVVIPCKIYGNADPMSTWQQIGIGFKTAIDVRVLMRLQYISNNYVITGTFTLTGNELLTVVSEPITDGMTEADFTVRRLV